MEGQPVVRQATPSDAAVFSALSHSVRYDPASADPSRGFLVFNGTPQEYAERLSASPHSVIAEDEDGSPLGYLLAVLLSPGEKNGTRVLVDQICVSPAARGRGVARAMYGAVMESARPREVWASIMHRPLRNERSLRFFTEKNGFRLIHEQEEPPFVFGYYWREYRDGEFAHSPVVFGD